MLDFIAEPAIALASYMLPSSCACSSLSTKNFMVKSCYMSLASAKEHVG